MGSLASCNQGLTVVKVLNYRINRAFSESKTHDDESQKDGPCLKLEARKGDELKSVSISTSQERVAFVFVFRLD